MATIVLSPGAWISTSFYQDFANIFMASGHPVHFAPYPSLNPADPKTADCKHDADAISKILRPLVEDQGRDVVLVMHSYAGMPAAAAASGLSKTKRMKEAKKGGIIGLVFIAAFLVPEGLTCAGLQGGKLPHWIIQDKVSETYSTDTRHTPHTTHRLFPSHLFSSLVIFSSFLWLFFSSFIIH